MSYYSDTYPYEWEPDMEQWLMRVPLGSKIKQCTQYLSACFHAWQRTLEKAWHTELVIPRDDALEPGAAGMNDHRRHVNEMESECLKFWKEQAKSRRGLKRRNDAVVRCAKQSGDREELASALQTQEWTSIERARMKDSSRSFHADVEKYRADHILL